MFVEMLSYIPS